MKSVKPFPTLPNRLERMQSSKIFNLDTFLNIIFFQVYSLQISYSCFLWPFTSKTSGDHAPIDISWRTLQSWTVLLERIWIKCERVGQSNAAYFNWIHSCTNSRLSYFNPLTQSGRNIGSGFGKDEIIAGGDIFTLWLAESRCSS